MFRKLKDSGLLFVVFFCLSVVPGKTEVQKLFLSEEYTVRNSPIEKEIILEMNRRESLDAQVDYLISVVINGESPVEERKSAIRLLGMTGSERAIPPLIKSIKLLDKNKKTYPAVFALADIGKESIPYTVELIEKSRDKKEVELAVQVIKEIEGSLSNYIRKSKAPPSPKLKGALRYDIDD